MNDLRKTKPISFDYIFSMLLAGKFSIFSFETKNNFLILMIFHKSLTFLLKCNLDENLDYFRNYVSICNPKFRFQTLLSLRCSAFRVRLLKTYSQWSFGLEVFSSGETITCRRLREGFPLTKEEFFWNSYSHGSINQCINQNI